MKNLRPNLTQVLILCNLKALKSTIIILPKVTHSINFVNREIIYKKISKHFIQIDYNFSKHLTSRGEKKAHFLSFSQKIFQNVNSGVPHISRAVKNRVSAKNSTTRNFPSAKCKIAQGFSLSPEKRVREIERERARAARVKA